MGNRVCDFNLSIPHLSSKQLLMFAAQLLCSTDIYAIDIKRYRYGTDYDNIIF